MWSLTRSVAQFGLKNQPQNFLPPTLLATLGDANLVGHLLLRSYLNGFNIRIPG